LMELPLTSLLTIHPPAGRVSRMAARGLSSLLSPARARGGRTDAKHCDRGRRAGRATRPSSLPRCRCERTRCARPPSPRASDGGRGCAELTDTLWGRRPMGFQRQTRSSKIAVRRGSTRPSASRPNSAMCESGWTRSPHHSMRPRGAAGSNGAHPRNCTSIACVWDRHSPVEIGGQEFRAAVMREVTGVADPAAVEPATSR